MCGGGGGGGGGGLGGKENEYLETVPTDLH